MDGLEEPGPADLENFCLDLVTDKSNEATARALLTKHQPGRWVAVGGILTRNSTDDSIRALDSDVKVTWLPDPSEDPSFVLIIFFDDCSK